MEYTQSKLMKEALSQCRFVNSHEQEITNHLNNDFKGVAEFFRNVNNLRQTSDEEQFWVTYDICLHYGIVINKYIKTMNELTVDVIAAKDASNNLKKIRSITIDENKRLKMIKYFTNIFQFMQKHRIEIIKMLNKNDRTS